MEKLVQLAPPISQYIKTLMIKVTDSVVQDNLQWTPVQSTHTLQSCCCHKYWPTFYPPKIVIVGSIGGELQQKSRLCRGAHHSTADDFCGCSLVGRLMGGYRAFCKIHQNHSPDVCFPPEYNMHLQFMCWTAIALVVLKYLVPAILVQILCILHTSKTYS